jgi:hypothetical protein
VRQKECPQQVFHPFARIEYPPQYLGVVGHLQRPQRAELQPGGCDPLPIELARGEQHIVTARLQAQCKTHDRMQIAEGAQR